MSTHNLAAAPPLATRHPEPSDPVIRRGHDAKGHAAPEHAADEIEPFALTVRAADAADADLLCLALCSAGATLLLALAASLA